MSLAFRNVAAQPEDPVESWPAEAIHDALARGGLSHWRRLAAAIRADPWGPVARGVEEAIAVDPPHGVSVLMDEVIVQARQQAERLERAAVADEIGQLVTESGLTRAAFATAVGTSASRLSTYLGGSVTPSAALVVRMRRMVARVAAAPRA